MRVCRHPESKNNICDPDICGRWLRDDYIKFYTVCGFAEIMLAREYRELFTKRD